MITVTIKGNRELRATLNRMGADAPKAAAAALYKEAERIMAESKPLVPVDMGVLRASGHVQPPKIDGTKVSVMLGYGGAAAGYATFVHEGVGPAVGHGTFFPPPEALRAWAARHGIPTDKGTLFVLARAIGRKGFRGSHYLSRPLKAAQQGMSKRLARSIWERMQKQARNRAAR